MDNEQLTVHYKSVKKVLWQVLIANIIITVIKLILGTITGSLAVIADGFHSMVDSSSNIIGLAAIRLATRPADEQYPYGYKRYETLGALAIGGLLLVAAWEIIQGVFDRIFQGAEPEITWLTFSLITLTLPVNIAVVILESRAGRRLNSEILIADANHTRTDLYVTGSVVASVMGVWLGWSWLDIVVTGVVVILIIRASIGILRSSAGTLADVAGVDPKKVELVAENVTGVSRVHKVRSRGTEDAIFVDLHVLVDPAMSTSQAHAVASEVERQVCSIGTNIVDAIVHIEPSNVRGSNDWEKISFGLRQISDGMGLSLHDLHVHVNSDGEYSIDLDLEMQADATLKQAHDLADEFERRAMHYWPDAIQINSHLEPTRQKLIFSKEKGDSKMDEDITNYLYSILDPIEMIDVHSSIVEERTSVVLKIPMRGDISLVESHDKVEEIKRSLIKKFPGISRVVIHVEPLDDHSQEEVPET